MQKEFVTYEIAEGLNNIGFDSPCLAFYHDKSEDNKKANCTGEFVSLAGWTRGRYNTNDLSSHDFLILAPLWQQAVSWLWEKYGIFIGFEIGSEYITCSSAERFHSDGYFKIYSSGVDYYEAAKWILTHTIERILKERNNNGDSKI